MRNSLVVLFVVIAAFCTLWSASPASAGLTASYNPDTLTAGPTATPVTTLGDSSGNGNTLTSYGGTPLLYGLNTAGADAAFNGHNYISYSGGSGLTTSPLAANGGALYTGGNDRSLATVYVTPVVNGGMNAFVAGQAPAATAGELTSWYGIESRNNNVTGNPYVVTFGAGTDLSTNGNNTVGNPGNPPVAGQLTFALATYNATLNGGTESLYWAYGLHGAVGSISVSGIGLNTASYPFTVGSSGDGNSPVEVGNVVVWKTAPDSAAAIGEIQSLQAYYASATPEPSSLVVWSLGLVGLLLAARRRRKAN